MQACFCPPLLIGPPQLGLLLIERDQPPELLLPQGLKAT
jgi:hypothetical protein